MLSIGVMLNPWLPRTPAHDTLHPRETSWQPLPEERAVLLRQWSGLDGRVLQMRGGHRFPAGYFQIRERKKSRFVKITASRNAARIEAADRMAAFAGTHEVRVNCLLPGFPRSAETNHALFAYPYIDGSFSSGDPQQLASLGQAVAHLHQALRQCPWQQDVRHHGSARQQMLRNRLQQIRQGQCHGIPAAAVSLLSQVEIDQLDILYHNAQVVHGDLNAGNILFPRESRQPVFLDFEDSLTAWFSPLTDLAYLLERFALTGPSAPAATEQILQNYYRAGGMRFESADQLNRILRALAVRALLLLAEKAVQQDDVPPATDEWRKFLSLHHAATQPDRQMADLITRLRGL